MPIRNEQVPPQQIVAERFDPSTQKWRSIRDAIVKIETACFSDDERFSDSELEKFFENSNNVIALLWDCNEVIGFSIARPVSEIWPERASEMDTYNITTTDILPIYQGKGCVGLLMKILENGLKAAGARYIERNAKVDNGYADTVAKHYAKSIVEVGEPRVTQFGIQKFFRIELAV